MQLVTRADLGWPESAAPLQPTTRGVKIHYEGTPVSTSLLADHGACLREWQNIRASHLANTEEKYSDVAYNYAACPHGYLLEGRGLGHRTGANGNQDLNRAHYAIVGLVGSDGLTQPTDAMLHALRDGIELLQRNGAGGEIRGHRDGYATSCPGEPLYRWVQQGAPRPGGSAPAPAPDPAAFPGAGQFGPGRSNAYVTQLGQMLVERGGSRFYTVGPGPDWSEADRAATAAFQRAQGWDGADADGLPGPLTWELLVSGRGSDIPPAAPAGPPPFPGRDRFGPGRVNDSVLQLGEQLVRKGFGGSYRVGPSRSWSEADRLNVAAFQRSRPELSGDADGYPGPLTWQLLFS